MTNATQNQSAIPQQLGPFQDLKRRVEITKDARFQANLRLERRNKLSYLVIALLSLFVIILSLVPNIYRLTQAGAQALLALSIINSVFIIITTFLEASGNFVHRGEQLHRSARKIATVYNKLVLLSPEEHGDRLKLQALQQEYQIALDDCPFNHENIDYELIKATKPGLFRSKPKGNWAEWFVIRWRFFKHLVYEYFWIAPHTLVFIGTICTLWWIVLHDGLGPTSFVGSQNSISNP